MKFIFTVFAISFLVYPLCSWSSLKPIQGIMKTKDSHFFHIFDPDENCDISIKRGVLDNDMDSFIDTNWEADEKLQVSVPSDSVTFSCDEEDVDTVDESVQFAQVQFDPLRYSSDSETEKADNRSSCDSPEYQASLDRVNAYNEEADDALRMKIPGCSGNDDNVPLCDSAEYQREQELAQSTGAPIGPCRQE